MKKAIRYAVLLLTPAVLIALEYSPNTYFRYFDFPFYVTLNSYIVIYVLVLGVSAVMAPFIARRITKSAIARAAVQAAIGTFGFAIFAWACAVTGFNPPLTWVFGIFFAEWKFMNFFFYVGLPVAIVSAATALLETRSEELIQMRL